MDIEKEIFRDMWQFLKTHNSPPINGMPGDETFWQRAIDDINELASRKWKDHPLAVEMSVALYRYLENKAEGGDSR